LTIAHVVKEASLPEASFLRIEKLKILNKISELDIKADQYRLNISEPWSKPTKLIGKITTSDTPISPKPPVVITLAVVLGGMLSLIYVFVNEFIYKSKSEEANSGEM